MLYFCIFSKSINSVFFTKVTFFGSLITKKIKLFGHNYVIGGFLLQNRKTIFLFFVQNCIFFNTDTLNNTSELCSNILKQKEHMSIARVDLCHFTHKSFRLVLLLLEAIIFRSFINSVCVWFMRETGILAHTYYLYMDLCCF